MRILHSMVSLIGDTPMIKLSRLGKKHDCKAEIAMKLEYFNPASSIKDRLAKAMVEDAEKKKKLKPFQNPPQVLVEATSGNTGIGLAFMAINRGYKLVLTMPENMSEERINLLRGLGAEVVLTPASEGMEGASQEAGRILRRTPGAVMLGQFTNPINVDMHYRSTGPEIWQQCAGLVDIFVTGIGTGGTITGIAKYLKERSKTVKVYGVEPEESPVLTQGMYGPHLIQGIGANFVPPLLDGSLLDGIIPVPSLKAIETARELITEESIFAGISSGAGAYAAILLAQRPENAGKRIVCIACDTAERYLSTQLFKD